MFRNLMLRRCCRLGRLVKLEGISIKVKIMPIISTAKTSEQSSGAWTFCNSKNDDIRKCDFIHCSSLVSLPSNGARSCSLFSPRCYFLEQFLFAFFSIVSALFFPETYSSSILFILDYIYWYKIEPSVIFLEFCLVSEIISCWDDYNSLLVLQMIVDLKYFVWKHFGLDDLVLNEERLTFSEFRCKYV